jgi:hypothetical protein
MDYQQDQDDFDEIVVEDAASEPTGCLGQVMIVLIVVLLCLR